MYAILCNILAIAETTSPGEPGVHMDYAPGYGYYACGKNLLQYGGASSIDCLELAIYHTLACSYLLSVERLGLAARQLNIAIHVALTIGLNDSSRWICNLDEIALRTPLWWVLMYLDRRVHSKCGVPYLIHKNDIKVGEPNDGNCSELAQPQRYLLISMYTYSMLWTSIWDEFLAANAPPGRGWYDMLVADAKIKLSMEAEWPGLQWETEKVRDYVCNREHETALRWRLMNFLVSAPQFA
jgi:hypothetical protein